MVAYKKEVETDNLWNMQQKDIWRDNQSSTGLVRVADIKVYYSLKAGSVYSSVSTYFEDESEEALNIALSGIWGADGRSSVLDGMEDAKEKNIALLSKIMESQNKEDDDYVSEKVIDNALKMVFHMKKQPELFKTFENSIHMQFELSDDSYLEFEVFENRITCMLVPQRKYEEATFSVLQLDNMEEMNKIIGEFYEITG